MSDLNLTIFQGRLTKNPELKQTNSGKFFVIFPVASNNYFKKDEKWEKDTTFLNIKCWDNLALSVVENLKKGDQILVYGKIKQSVFTDPDNIRKNFYFLHAQKIERFDNSGKRKRLNSVKTEILDIEDEELVKITDT